VAWWKKNAKEAVVVAEVVDMWVTRNVEESYPHIHNFGRGKRGQRAYFQAGGNDLCSGKRLNDVMSRNRSGQLR
jgi:hypothetical protein